MQAFDVSLALYMACHVKFMKFNLGRSFSGLWNEIIQLGQGILIGTEREALKWRPGAE